MTWNIPKEWRDRARALRKELDRDCPKINGKWFTVHGHRIRRHTLASSVIFKVLRDLTWTPHKHAFRIEDALRRKGLLKDE